MRWVLPALTSLVIATPAISDAMYPTQRIDRRVWLERRVNTLTSRVDTLEYVLRAMLTERKPNVIRLRQRIEQSSCHSEKVHQTKSDLKI